LNADAQDWIDRVVANGGSVSTATAAAVNQFCVDIDAASIRSKMLRLNLFAGSNLNAALVPLYRAGSLGDTQLGSATDTNNAFVGVGTDYAETGASGGLTGNGTSKYLDTGVTTTDLGANTDSGHISAYHSVPTGPNANRAFMGNTNTGNFRRFQLLSSIFSSSSIAAQWGGSGINANVAGLGNQVGAPAGHRLVSRASDTSLTHYLNASSVASSSSTNASTNDVTTETIFVHAINSAGTAASFNNGRILAYSIGLGLDSQQVTDFYNAMQTFQTALTRNV
jgi:hypothetical protein